jgi:hypothetical protein
MGQEANFSILLRRKMHPDLPGEYDHNGFKV